MKLAPQDEITEAGMPRLRLVLEILRVQTLQKLLQLVLTHILVQWDRLRLVQDLFPDIDGSACSDGIIAMASLGLFLSQISRGSGLEKLSSGRVHGAWISSLRASSSSTLQDLPGQNLGENLLLTPVLGFLAIRRERRSKSVICLVQLEWLPQSSQVNMAF